MAGIARPCGRWGCPVGGTIRVREKVEKVVMKLDILHSLNAERAARRAAVVVTDVATGAQRFARPPTSPAIRCAKCWSASAQRQERHGGDAAGPRLPHRLRAGAAARHHRRGAYQPGAGADGAAARLRRDHRRSAHRVCEPRAFPDVKVIAEWPDEALPPLDVDRYTAFVALTHDPKIDDPALLHALARDCFYIGALGSRKTHARRLERLKAQGLTDAELARIHAPIGLAIGAVSPPEIAVSIMGEITARLREESRPSRADEDAS